MNSDERLIGVISDTHGLLRPEAASALSGVELILHAGDVHNQYVLDELGKIAPVIAVRGNHDKAAWARELNEVETIQLGAISIAMIHDLKQLKIDSAANDLRVVISGHSHKPVIESRAGVIYLNPGSAGPKRFKLPVTVALLRIAGENVRAEIVEILRESIEPTIE